MTEYREQTYITPKAVITVQRPILTEEEYQRRLEEFKQATARFMTAVEAERQATAEKKEKAE